MATLRAALRAVSVVGLVASAAAVLLAVANLADAAPLDLHRTREPSLAFFGCLALWLLASDSPARAAASLLERARDGLERPQGFRLIAGVALALYVADAVTHHLAFETYSHDFSMFDGAIDHAARGLGLYSSVLGRSVLSEHFAPSLVLFVPLHALLPSPWLLVLAQPLLLWSAVFPLRSLLLRGAAIPRWQAHLVCLAYLGHATTISTLEYLFHMECMVPLLLFATLDALERGRRVLGVGLLVALLGVKEDMGLYVCGLALALLARRSHRAMGWTLMALGAVWTWATLAIALPHWAGDLGHYRFIGRWASWGSTPAAVLVGFLRDPLRLLARMFNRGCVSLVLALGSLPLAALAGPQRIAIALPWMLNATSDLTLQSRLGLYYGIPMLAFLLVAVALGLRDRRDAWPRSPRWAAVLAAWLVVANVMNLSFPHVPRERGRILAGIARLPADAPVTASSCFFPWLGYRRPAVLIRDLTPPATPYVLLMKGRGGWPLSGEQSDAFEAVCDRSGYARLWRIGSAELFGRAPESPRGAAAGGDH